MAAEIITQNGWSRPVGLGLGRKLQRAKASKGLARTGVDAFEMNLSCPHGMPERRMGLAMGEDPERVAEVVGWVKEVSTIPVWAKMTPNVTHPKDSALAATGAGAGRNRDRQCGAR